VNGAITPVNLARSGCPAGRQPSGTPPQVVADIRPRHMISWQQPELADLDLVVTSRSVTERRTESAISQAAF